MVGCIETGACPHILVTLPALADLLWPLLSSYAELVGEPVGRGALHGKDRGKHQEESTQKVVLKKAKMHNQRPSEA